VLLKTLLLDAGYADRKSFIQSALYKQKSKERIKKFNLRFRKEGQKDFDTQLITTLNRQCSLKGISGCKYSYLRGFQQKKHAWE